MAILYISHDLLSVASLRGRLAILERGSIVEAAETGNIFQRPEHPYTRRLVSSIPSMPDRRGSLEALAQATAASRREREAEPAGQG